MNIDNIDEMYDLAKNDITIKTSLLESRYIFGSKKIYEDFELFVKNLRQIDKKAFVQEQLTTHTQRLLKYPLNMQVNLKDGYGGIREANMLFWILNVVWMIVGQLHIDKELYKYSRKSGDLSLMELVYFSERMFLGGLTVMFVGMFVTITNVVGIIAGLVSVLFYYNLVLRHKESL